jgi:hypothetical protein
VTYKHNSLSRKAEGINRKHTQSITQYLYWQPHVVDTTNYDRVLTVSNCFASAVAEAVFRENKKKNNDFLLLRMRSWVWRQDILVASNMAATRRGPSKSGDGGSSVTAAGSSCLRHWGPVYSALQQPDHCHRLPNTSVPLNFCLSRSKAIKVLIILKIDIPVFWDITPCSPKKNQVAFRRKIFLPSSRPNNKPKKDQHEADSRTS